MNAVVACLLALVLSTAPGDLQVTVTTTSGETVSGTLALKSVRLKTDFGSAEIVAEALDSISFGDPDTVVTKGGVELTGKLELSTLKLALDKGSRSFRTADLVTLEVGAGASSAGAGFEGEWMTSSGPMELRRSGAKLAGKYGWSDESKIEGKLERKRFTFEWSGPYGRGEGWFELWKDGHTFTGEYTYPGGKDAWGGYRRAPAAAPVEPGEVTDGQTRSGLNYHLRVPKGFDRKSRYTAVALFHGSNTNSRDYVEGFPGNWPELAERFILVGFDGERLSGASREPTRAFNASYVEFSGDHVGEPWRYNQTPWLVAQALDQLGAELPVERWFVGGHSQGGFLTLAVAMFYPERIAGAFEVAGNLLVQCEPSTFTDEKVRAAQRRVPIAIVHGEKDDVVEFSAATYTHEALQDGGFPLLRLFNDPQAGHPWAFLPVDDALRWLEALSSSDPGALLAFAEKSIEEQRWRDATGALGRARELLHEDSTRARVDALLARIDQAAASEAAALSKAIAANKDGSWVDSFWEFRERFAFAPAARGVLEAYRKLRDAHQKPADERFYRARGLEDAQQKKALYREIVEEYYASSWYRLVKRWL
jgi:predicted esterase